MGTSMPISDPTPPRDTTDAMSNEIQASKRSARRATQTQPLLHPSTPIKVCCGTEI
jgi:hypothetical protein